MYFLFVVGFEIIGGPSETAKEFPSFPNDRGDALSRRTSQESVRELIDSIFIERGACDCFNFQLFN